MLTLRILRWEDYLGISRWEKCNPKNPDKQECRRVREKEKRKKKGNVTTEIEVE